MTNLSARDLQSGLAFINVKENTSPFELVSDWLKEAETHGIVCPIVNIATSSKTGDVTNRSVFLQEYQNQKFIFVTDQRSTKSEQLAENPKVAACLVLQYTKEGKFITRQIRIEGTVAKLPYEDTLKYWNTDPLYAQIRTLLADNIGTIIWEEKSQRHEELLKQARTGVKFCMPEYHVGFKISPNRLNFYHGEDMLIADKINFKNEGNAWKFERVV